MRQGTGWRALTWAVAALLLVNACATVPLEGTGGSGRPSVQRGPYPGSQEWDDLGGARQAELESAIEQMWGVASEVKEPGAVLEFTWWAEGGAFTLLSLNRRERGQGQGGTADRESFASEARELLSTSAEGLAGPVRLTLRREERRWRVDFHREEGAEFPREAKTWPVQRVGVRAEVLQGLVAAGKQVASRVWVPAGARVRWQVEVALEDERVTGLETTPPRSLPGGAAVRAGPELVGTWVNVLVPFAQGLGPRKVRMEWEGTSIAGTGRLRWKLVAAGVLRPPPPEPRNAEVALEYYAMHEQIQRQWRQETHEAFRAAGAFTAEQVALWVVGGWVARGAGLVTEAAAPTVARVLARGGSEAVGWLRSLLARAAPAEKQAFARLVAKAETEGLEALTVAERGELRTFLSRLDKLASTPLDELGQAKKQLRREARELFFQRFHPELASILRDARGVAYEIHHCVPLEYAYLFPLRDINAEVNLVAAAKPVHVSVNNVWTRLRQAERTPTSEEVLRVEEIVRRHFGRWFSKLYDGSADSAGQLAAAEIAATNEVDALLAAMR